MIGVRGNQCPYADMAELLDNMRPATSKANHAGGQIAQYLLRIGAEKALARVPSTHGMPPTKRTGAPTIVTAARQSDTLPGRQTSAVA